jgi:ribosomal protein S18 acetylase RimI-like enzyme
MTHAVETPHGMLCTRPETADDVAFLTALHDSVLAPSFARMPMPEAMRRQLLDMQFRAMTQGYRSGFPSARFDVVTLNGAPIGRLITDVDGSSFHVIYVALLPDWRGKAVGMALLREVLIEPKRRGLRCFATVAPDNVASLSLWMRLGFVERERGDTNVVVEWRPG